MVNKQLLHPQEIETFYLLPTIRKYFALALQEQGMKQKEIAALLGINSATISQYRSNKRGHQIELPHAIIQEIKIAAVGIKDQLSYFQQTQKILQRLREEKILCQIHRKFSPVPETCHPTHVGCLPETAESKYLWPK